MKFKKLKKLNLKNWKKNQIKKGSPKHFSLHATFFGNQLIMKAEDCKLSHHLR